MLPNVCLSFALTSFKLLSTTKPLARSYVCRTGEHGIQTCLSVFPLGFLQAQLCTSDTYNSTSSYISSTLLAFPESSVDYAILFAPLIQLVYQPSDLLGLDYTFRTQSLPANTDAARSNGHHFATSTIAGIVIGALLGTVSLVAVVYYLLWQRQRFKKRVHKKPSAVGEWLKSKLPGQTKTMYEPHGGNVEESPTGATNIPQELHVPGVIHELQAGTVVHELQGTVRAELR